MLSGIILFAIGLQLMVASTVVDLKKRYKLAMLLFLIGFSALDIGALFMLLDHFG